MNCDIDQSLTVSDIRDQIRCKEVLKLRGEPVPPMRRLDN